MGAEFFRDRKRGRAMRYLIDGYNLMYARGLMVHGQRLPGQGLLRLRRRFLDDLVDRLGAVDAHQATVVFDASEPPPNAPRLQTHKGISVVFAVDDENADERIELMLARESAPRQLTVVSSDRRVQEAARRKGAGIQTADAFLDELDRRAELRRDRRKPTPTRSSRPATAEEQARLSGLSPDEAAEWMRVFGEVEREPEVKSDLGSHALLTDEEIARIAREIAEEEGEI